MPDIKNQDIGKILQKKGNEALIFLRRHWYLVLLGICIGGGLGYFSIVIAKPTYTANISFVLSTSDARPGNNLANLASQLGFDATTASPDNMFSGDNILELFKSRSLIGASLMSVIDTPTHETLLNYIIKYQYPEEYKKAGYFGDKPKVYNKFQTELYRKTVDEVSQSFTVYKKDKKLIFYFISAQSTNPNIAYYIDKYVLNETSKYFIATKTKVAATSVALLQHEADSLGKVLSLTYSSTAAMIDRTYNLNPSITIQRSGSQFNISKATAFSAAYTEVMRNLEIAKVNLQKETPLYKIVDEPDLPLVADHVPQLSRIIVFSILGLFTMSILLTAFFLFKSRQSANYNDNIERQLNA